MADEGSKYSTERVRQTPLKRASYTQIAMQTNDLTPEQQLQLLISSDAPYLLHFTADWCGPCKRCHPEVHRLVLEKKPAYLCIDIDKEPDIAEQYGVTSIPTFLHGHADQVISQFSGANMVQFAELVDAVIAPVRIDTTVDLPRAP